MRDKVFNILLISLYNDFKLVWEIFKKYICIYVIEN